MATTRRRQSLAVIDQLSNEAWRFNFLQAVRLLDYAVSKPHARNEGFANQALAGLSPPSKELLRFSNQATLGFSASNVSSIAIEENHEQNTVQRQWKMSVQFFGLAGSQGVMPHYFTEILLQRLKDNDEVLSHFVSLFEHRSISLFYQASHKYQLPLQFEKNRLHQNRNPDIFTDALASLSGISTPRMSEKLAIPEEAILGYSGLYARPIRSAAALKSMLSHYFELEAEIEQFCGQWQDLPTDFISRLAGGEAGPGINNQLGMNSLLGKSCWQVQSKFRIHLATMNYDSFMELVPGGKKLKALQNFISTFAGNELDYELCIKLEKENVQPTTLSTEVGKEPLLGWNTPLGQLPDSEADSAVNIVVSKHTIPPDAGLPTAA